MDNITSRPQISSLPGRWAQLWVCVCTPSTVGVTRFCAATPRLVSAEPPSWALKSPADRDWHQLTSGPLPVTKVTKRDTVYPCDYVWIWKLSVSTLGKKYWRWKIFIKKGNWSEKKRVLYFLGPPSRTCLSRTFSLSFIKIFFVLHVKAAKLINYQGLAN